MDKVRRHTKPLRKFKRKKTNLLPPLDCLKCENHRTDKYTTGTLSVWCIFVRGRELYRKRKHETLNSLNAPADCPKRLRAQEKEI